MEFNPDAVRAFEHAGWQRAAGEYDRTFARASAPFVEVLLDAAGAAAGTRMLDVCCGTGVVAGRAAERGAVMTGIDFSRAMLAEARRGYPRLRFDEGFASLAISLGGIARLVRIDEIRHVPVGPLIEKYLGPLLAKGAP